jgi:hypothetical protein
MANSTASIFIKPTVTFNRCCTFVFSSWVCTADGVGSFQRRLTMTPDPKTGLVTLPKVVTDDLAGKFGEISLYIQHADFELGSASNSNSTSPWAIACELAAQPLCAASPLHEHFPYGIYNVRRARAKALPMRNERRRRLHESLPIRNLAEALDQVENRVHTTPEQCLMSITTIARQAQGMRTGEVIAKLVEDAVDGVFWYTKHFHYTLGWI